MDNRDRVAEMGTVGWGGISTLGAPYGRRPTRTLWPGASAPVPYAASVAAERPGSHRAVCGTRSARPTSPLPHPTL